MNSDPELTASWRADANRSQPFDEDLQVIQPKATKKKLAPSAEDLRPTGRPALLEGLSKPFVYHRPGNLSTALQTLVHLLEESRTIASATRPGKDADDLDFAVQQVARAWKDFVLPLAWMNGPNAVKHLSKTLTEDERNARQAVDDRLLALASATQSCLDYGMSGNDVLV